MSLDGLSEQQAHTRLVAATTLLGLAKHATFVERLRFDEVVTRRSREEIDMATGPAESFKLGKEDTIATVQEAHRQACQASRLAVATSDLDEVLTGSRRNPLPLRWVYLHVLRELASTVGTPTSWASSFGTSDWRTDCT